MDDYILNNPITQEMPDIAAAEASSNIAPSWRRAFSALLQTNPTRAIGRTTALGKYYPGVIGGGESGTTFEVPAEIPSPTISVEEAERRFGVPGLHLFKTPLPELAAQEIGRQARERQEREDILERYSANASTLGQVSTGILAGMADPLNIAAGFMPGIGEGAILSRLGSSLAARATARLGAGAATGVMTQAPVSALHAAFDRDGEFGWREALYETMLGGASVAALHAGFGALGDAWRGWRGRKERVPAQSDIDIHLNNGSDNEKSTSREPEIDWAGIRALLNSDATTSADAMRAAVAQTVEGEPVEVRPVLQAGEEVHTRPMGPADDPLVQIRPEDIDGVMGADAPLSRPRADTTESRSGIGSPTEPDTASGPNDSSLTGRMASTSATLDPSLARVYTGAGRAIDVRHEVVDLKDLTVSHDANLNVNPNYPAELQPRERERVASGVQITKMAGSLTPERLGWSPDAATGAPIVGPDGVVESGNGRTLALRMAYEKEHASAQTYRDWLAGQGHNVGDMEMPILIRRRLTPLTADQRVEFAHEANSSGTLAMSAAERARADARHLTPGVLDLLRSAKNIGAAANRDFVRAFFSHLSPDEYNALADSKGNLSQEGRRRIEHALLARAYDDPGLLAQWIEREDSHRSISNALIDVAALWAKMRSAVAEGRVAPQMDITPALIDAVRLVDHARENGKSVASALQQGDLFKGRPPDPLVAELVRMMYRNPELTRVKSREALAADLTRYLEQARLHPAGPSMLGDRVPPVQAQDILTHRESAPGVSPAELAQATQELKAATGRVIPKTAKIESGDGKTLTVYDHDHELTIAERSLENMNIKLHPEDMAELRTAHNEITAAQNLAPAVEEAAVCLIKGEGL